MRTKEFSFPFTNFITESFELEGILKVTCDEQGLPCHDEGHLQPEQIARSPINLTLKMCCFGGRQGEVSHLQDDAPAQGANLAVSCLYFYSRMASALNPGQWTQPFILVCAVGQCRQLCHGAWTVESAWEEWWLLFLWGGQHVFTILAH